MWVGAAATLTAAWAMAQGDEPASVAQVLRLLALVGGIVGLRLTH